MNKRELRQLFKDTDCVRRSGTAEELRTAEYLRERCERLGAAARLESFPVPMGEMEEARVFADGKEIPCRGFFCCGSGEAEGELYYMPARDPVWRRGALHLPHPGAGGVSLAGKGPLVHRRQAGVCGEGG